VNLSTIRDRRFLVLLSTLAIGLVVQSLNRGFVASTLLAEGLLVVALLVVFWVVFERTRQRLATLAAAALAIILSGAHHFLAGPQQLELALAFHGLMMVFLGWAAVQILRGLFAGRVARADDVLGALCAYLIAGWAWANLYALTELLVPGSFSVSADIRNELAAWHDRQALFTYYSFVTLTTVGYGDMTPVRAPATTIVLAEAVFGQFYVAIVVAQIVGMRLAQALKPH